MDAPNTVDPMANLDKLYQHKHSFTFYNHKTGEVSSRKPSKQRIPSAQSGQTSHFERPLVSSLYLKIVSDYKTKIITNNNLNPEYPVAIALAKS